MGSKRRSQGSRAHDSVSSTRAAERSTRAAAAERSTGSATAEGSTGPATAIAGGTTFTTDARAAACRCGGPAAPFCAVPASTSCSETSGATVSSATARAAGPSPGALCVRRRIGLGIEDTRPHGQCHDRCRDEQQSA